MNPTYLATARLLAQVAPLVLVDDQLALKGGTAINLFLRDMPRLSVDLDLAFTDHTVARPEALARISSAVAAMAERLRANGYEVFVPQWGGGNETTLIARRRTLQVKVQINTVIRGTVYPVQRASLSAMARDTLLVDLQVPILAPEDIYGGKLVAALDRQHPRDLFDVMELFAQGGITPGIRRAFVVYLASHDRPVHEVLYPTLKDVRLEYERNFQGMTSNPVDFQALMTARDHMIREIHTTLDADERRFLLSLVHAEPEWGLLGVSHLSALPAIRWKLRNLERLRREQPERFAKQYAALAEGLGRLA